MSVRYEIEKLNFTTLIVWKNVDYHIALLTNNTKEILIKRGTNDTNAETTS